MSDLPEPRIADADRDRVNQRLRVAFAEGRITESELEERLTAVFEARTASELTVVVADLPPAPVAAVRPASVERSWPKIQRQVAAPFIVAPVICTLIYFMTNPGGYFWPMWVWLGCSVPVLLGILSGSSDDDDGRPDVPPPTAPQLP